MKFAVEMSSDNLAGYAKVHVAGCRDLVDPEPVEVELTRNSVSKNKAEIEQAVEQATGWDDDSFSLSPCVEKVLKGVQA